MEVIFNVTDNVLIAQLFGELDHHAAAHVRKDIDEAMQDYSAQNLIFDFGRVRYMDSSGIGMVLGRYRRLQETGGSIVIASCSDTVRNILNMAGVFSLMEYRDTTEEAVLYFKGKEAS